MAFGAEIRESHLNLSERSVNRQPNEEIIGMKIIDNVYVVPEVVANPYIIVDSYGLTIIDVGLPRSEKKILAYVVSLGQSVRDVKRIIITHADFDHFGSLAALHRLTGARMYTSKIEADAIAQGKSSRQIKIPASNWRRRWSNLFFNIFMKPTPIQVDEILMVKSCRYWEACVWWKPLGTRQVTFLYMRPKKEFCFAATQWLLMIMRLTRNRAQLQHGIKPFRQSLIFDNQNLARPLSARVMVPL